MSIVRTRSAWMLPPPRPPIGVATAAGEPEPERERQGWIVPPNERSAPKSPTGDAILYVVWELRRMVWPHATQVSAQGIVVILQLAIWVCYLSMLGWLVQGALLACGIKS